MCGRPGEILIEKPLLLGPDLQCLYTTAEKIAQIARITAPFKVEVRDLRELSSAEALF